MPIEILKEDERLKYEKDGSTIFYRRISTYKRGLIIKRHTKRGKTDFIEVTKDIMEYVILDWDGVQRGKEKIGFDPELIPFIPEEDTTEILELSGASDTDGNEVIKQGLEKNLSPSSSGK